MLDGWHDFYVILATAAGTLIGAMFVVASIAGRIVRKARAVQVGAFFTATVFHLSAVLFACLLVMMPTLSSPAFGIIVGLGGLAGLGLASRAGLWVRRHSNIDATDRLWYAAIPVASYILVAVAAVLIVDGMATGPEILALALCLLVAAGIRNAWDMIIFIVGKDDGAP